MQDLAWYLRKQRQLWKLNVGAAVAAAREALHGNLDQSGVKLVERTVKNLVGAYSDMLDGIIAERRGELSKYTFGFGAALQADLEKFATCTMESLARLSASGAPAATLDACARSVGCKSCSEKVLAFNASLEELRKELGDVAQRAVVEALFSRDGKNGVGLTIAYGASATLVALAAVMAFRESGAASFRSFAGRMGAWVAEQPKAVAAAEQLVVRDVKENVSKMERMATTASELGLTAGNIGVAIAAVAAVLASFVAFKKLAGRPVAEEQAEHRGVNEGSPAQSRHGQQSSE